MRTTYLLGIIVAIILNLSACAGSMKALSKTEIEEAVKIVEEKPSYIKLDKAQQTVALALEYHDQGGYERSAEFFLSAADLYRELYLKPEERRAVVAAAKVQLRCSKRQTFLLTMARFRGLLNGLEMPSEEERFLLNLSDHMKEKPLTYPIISSWETVFKNP